MHILIEILFKAVYVPALAFAQVSGIEDIHMITPVVMGICIFYTMLGK